MLENQIVNLEKSLFSMSDRFKILANETSSNQTQHFLKITNELINRIHLENRSYRENNEKHTEKILEPLLDLTKQINSHCQVMEKNQDNDRNLMKQHIENIAIVAHTLQAETVKVINSLRSPNIRGMWGEMQLKRLVEISGMQEYCDFQCQKEMGGIRPDMVINIPGGGVIIIDAKTPLVAFTEAMSTEVDKKKKLAEHARHVKTHIKILSEKAYWKYFPDSPDFVVLFLPGECFLSAALESSAEILEYAFSLNVVLATPTTLMTLLRTVAYGWRNINISKDMEKIRDKLLSFHSVITELSEKIQVVGKSIDKTRKEFLNLEMFTRDSLVTELDNFTVSYSKNQNVDNTKTSPENE